MDERIDKMGRWFGLTDDWMQERLDDRMIEDWTDGWIDGWMNALTEWMDGRIVGRKDG